jgi:hypothetical protein
MARARSCVLASGRCTTNIYKGKTMKNKLLVIGIASLSLFAAAQTQPSSAKNDSSKPATTAASRDQASGKASGRMLKSEGIVHRDIAAREMGSGQASGKRQHAAAKADTPADSKKH